MFEFFLNVVGYVEEQQHRLCGPQSLLHILYLSAKQCLKCFDLKWNIIRETVRVQNGELLFNVCLTL
jgi:hypothetical protein